MSPPSTAGDSEDLTRANGLSANGAQHYATAANCTVARCVPGVTDGLIGLPTMADPSSRHTFGHRGGRDQY